MDIADRHQIVVLTAAFDGYAVNSYRRFVPTPIEATMLMLSPLGGWLRSAGVWDPPTKIRPRIRYVPIGVDHILKGRELEVAVRLGIDQAGIDQIEVENPMLMSGPTHRRRSLIRSGLRSISTTSTRRASSTSRSGRTSPLRAAITTCGWSTKAG